MHPVSGAAVVLVDVVLIAPAALAGPELAVDYQRPWLVGDATAPMWEGEDTLGAQAGVGVEAVW